MKKKISTELTILGIGEIAVGLLYTLYCISLLSLINVIPSLNVWLLFPLSLYILGGFGILLKLEWARRLTMFISLYNLIILLPKPLFIYGAASISPVVFLYFLTRPKIKEQFK